LFNGKKILINVIRFGEWGSGDLIS
jgi:hypothetical protein